MKAAILFLLLAAGARAATVDDLMRGSAEAYRQGNLLKALHGAALALEQDPSNAVVKNVIWKMAQEAKNRQGDPRLKDGEMEKAVALAQKDLAARRREAERLVKRLKTASEKSDTKSPVGLLTALGDLDKSLGTGFDAGRAGVQGALYMSHIVRNLSAALQKGLFVSRKDLLRAQGYLAYHQNNWPLALEKWEAAHREDPRDAQLKSDLLSLRELSRRRAEEKELQDLVKQAETYQQTGLYAQAVETWKTVLQKEKNHPGALEGLSVSRVGLEKSRLQKTLESMLENGVGLYQRGQYVKAAEVWLEALQLDPTYQKARAWLKLASGKLGEDPASRPVAPVPAPRTEKQTPAAAASGAAEADLRRAEDLYKQGLLLYANEKLGDAVDLWKKALKLNPDLAKAQEALRHAQAELSFR